MVKRRVEEELEKRRDEIELEVKRRVEQAKVEMEREMMLELERRREQIREEERRREVGARIQEFNSKLGAKVQINKNTPGFLIPHVHVSFPLTSSTPLPIKQHFLPHHFTELHCKHMHTYIRVHNHTALFLVYKRTCA